MPVPVPVAPLLPWATSAAAEAAHDAPPHPPLLAGFACDYCVHVLSVAEAHLSHRKGDADRSRTSVDTPLTQTLSRAAPSLYGAALTTAASAAPLLACHVLLFRQMGEFIIVCTTISLLVALTLITPLVHLSDTLPSESPSSPPSCSVAQRAGGQPEVRTDVLAATAWTPTPWEPTVQLTVQQQGSPRVQGVVAISQRVSQSGRRYSDFI